MTEPNPSTSTSSSIRTIKRKLDDAIRTLDTAAVSPTLAANTIERPTPSKRPHFTRTAYSTLSKFGATSKGRSHPPSNTHEIDVSKNAPHLAAILARSASQSNQSSSFSPISMFPPHPAHEYRPSSMDSFLSRLSTYKITTYANKPPQIDAVAAARCGWINNGKDRLICGMCDISWVLVGREGMKKDAASALVEKQRTSLVEMHKDGCPWRTRQCEPSIYRVPLQAPAPMIHELKATARSLESLLFNVVIKHPLTPLQLGSLHSIFAAESERRVSDHDTVADVDETMAPSETAMVAALFGWVPAPTTTRSELRRTSSMLLSHAGSYDPSVSRLPTPSPSLSRATSISNHIRERTSTPTPSSSPWTSISQFHTSPDRVGLSSRTKNLSFDNVAAVTVPPDASLVYCMLCHRRIGLWTYSKKEASSPSAQGEDFSWASHERQREFDLVKEHRSYCPYVVRSSTVPSLSQPPVYGSDGNAVEGWRAVMTIVQRYELSKRQRLGRFLPDDDLNNQTSCAELKGVEAMVAGVKTNGGRELLRYVKGLLG